MRKLKTQDKDKTKDQLLKELKTLHDHDRSPFGDNYIEDKDAGGGVVSLP